MQHYSLWARWHDFHTIIKLQTLPPSQISSTLHVSCKSSWNLSHHLGIPWLLDSADGCPLVQFPGCLVYQWLLCLQPAPLGMPSGHFRTEASTVIQVKYKINNFVSEHVKLTTSGTAWPRRKGLYKWDKVFTPTLNWLKEIFWYMFRYFASHLGCPTFCCIMMFTSLHPWTRVRNTRKYK